MWRWLVLIATGCDAILGLRATNLTDAPPPLDAFVLITPPDGTTTCAPPIDFSTWSFDAMAPPTPSIVAITSYSTSSGEHLLFAGDEPPGQAQIQWHILDWDLVGAPAPIVALDPPPADLIIAAGVSPDANLVWVEQTDGTYYATRASGWVKHPITFGLGQATVEVGSIGYYDGTARMVVVVNSTPQRLAELTSTDGLAWSEVANTLDTVAPGFAGVSNPELTSDGCALVFGGTPQIGVYAIYAAFRDATGAFGAAIRIPRSGLVGAPALSASRSSLWFVDFTTMPEQLVHGHP